LIIGQYLAKIWTVCLGVFDSQCRTQCCYRERKSWVVFQIQRCLWTTFEYLICRLGATVKRFHDGFLEFAHDFRALDHFIVDVICELHHTHTRVRLQLVTGVEEVIIGNCFSEIRKILPEAKGRGRGKYLTKYWGNNFQQ